MAAPRNDNNVDDKRMELTEHLGELRTHIIRSLWYLVIGAVVCYNLFAPLYGSMYRPLQQELKKRDQAMAKKHTQIGGQLKSATGDDILILPKALHDPPTREEFQQLINAVAWVHEHPSSTPYTSIVFRNFYEPFTVKVTIGVIFGLILTSPLVVREFALFLLPALTPAERKPLRALVPLSIFLLLCGIAVAYATMFYAMGWFLSYLGDFPAGAVLMQDPNDYIMFFVKMTAAFGIAFQLPVVLMGGAFMGLITSKGLIKNWRWGVLVAFLGGLFTPANDPMSWALMCGPLLLLYFGSILLVKMVENSRAKHQAV
jgi:sec-independent protein translocase protein TatC